MRAALFFFCLAGCWLQVALAQQEQQPRVEFDRAPSMMRPQRVGLADVPQPAPPRDAIAARCKAFYKRLALEEKWVAGWASITKRQQKCGKDWSCLHREGQMALEKFRGQTQDQLDTIEFLKKTPVTYEQCKSVPRKGSSSGLLKELATVKDDKREHAHQEAMKKHAQFKSLFNVELWRNMSIVMLSRSRMGQLRPLAYERASVGIASVVLGATLAVLVLGLVWRMFQDRLAFLVTTAALLLGWIFRVADYAVFLAERSQLISPNVRRFLTVFAQLSFLFAFSTFLYAWVHAAQGSVYERPWIRRGFAVGIAAIFLTCLALGIWVSAAGPMASDARIAVSAIFVSQCVFCLTLLVFCGLIFHALRKQQSMILHKNLIFMLVTVSILMVVSVFRIIVYGLDSWGFRGIPWTANLPNNMAISNALIFLGPELLLTFVFLGVMLTTAYGVRKTRLQRNKEYVPLHEDPSDGTSAEYIPAAYNL